MYRVNQAVICLWMYILNISLLTAPPWSQLGELGKGAGKGGGGGGSIREAGGAMGKKQAAEEEMYFKYAFLSFTATKCRPTVSSTILVFMDPNIISNPIFFLLWPSLAVLISVPLLSCSLSLFSHRLSFCFSVVTHTTFICPSVHKAQGEGAAGCTEAASPGGNWPPQKGDWTSAAWNRPPQGKDQEAEARWLSATDLPKKNITVFWWYQPHIFTQISACPVSPGQSWMCGWMFCKCLKVIKNRS